MITNPIDEFYGYLLDSVRYKLLQEKIHWFFETDEALRTVRTRLAAGKTTIGTYRELAVWAGEAESDLRKESKLDD